MTEIKDCEATGMTVVEKHGRRYHAEDQTPCFGIEGRYLQIIGASGWRGCFAWAGEAGEVVIVQAPLIGFALMTQCNGLQNVVPIEWGEGVAERADQIGNFIGLLGPGEEVDQAVRERAEGFLREERHRREHQAHQEQKALLAQGKPGP